MRMRFMVIVVCMIAICPQLLSAAVAVGESLPASIERVLQQHNVPRASLSVYLQPLDADQPALLFNARQARNPASVMKLLTSAAALDRLGPAYTWRTEAYTAGGLRDGRLDGDLVLKGYGDPYFTPERFWQFLRGVRDRGVREIDGDLILDQSHFAPPRTRRGDFDGKPQRAYNALPYALSLNFQATHLFVTPDPDSRHIRAFAYPPGENLRIDNALTPVSGPCRGKQRRPTVKVDRAGQQAILHLRGRYSVECPEFQSAYLILPPDRHIGGVFRTLWKELGGTLSGRVRLGTPAGDARLLHTQTSRSLDQVVRGMNKYSNNLMARLLLLTLGAEAGSVPATLESGRAVIFDWLKGQGLPTRNLVLDNGAGLSREARASAELLGRLLVNVYRGPQMPAFMASLPIAGIDGTLRRRLKNSALTGRANIKTGSLDDVSSMAGYVLDRQDRRWAVVLLINHAGITWQGRAIQDALLRWVYDV